MNKPNTQFTHDTLMNKPNTQFTHDTLMKEANTQFTHDTLMNKPNTQFAHGYINEGSKYSIWSFNICIYKRMIKANTPFLHLY